MPRIRPIVTTILVFAVGIWVGRVSVLSSSSMQGVGESLKPPRGGSRSRSVPPVTEERSGEAPWVAALEEGQVLDWLHRLESGARTELVRSLADWKSDPAEIVGFVIDAMDDREIRSALTSLTSLTEEDLDEVRDLRAFTRRVSEIAMDGVVSARGPESAGTATIRFSQSADTQNVTEQAQVRFAGNDRIFAIFPTEDYRYDEVFVKWYRSDDPEILLFDRYPIQREADFNYVWLDRDNGWPEGEYRVELYTVDDAMNRVASGDYVIDYRIAALEANLP